MAIAFVRSPFYVYEKYSAGGAAYGIMTITVDGNVEYTLRKDVVATYVSFEIAELLRDFINPIYNSPSQSFLSSQSKIYGTSVQFYNAYNAAIGIPQTTSGWAVSGYGYYEEGYNPTTAQGYMQSNNTIYRLADADVRIPVNRQNTSNVTFLYQGNIVYNKPIVVSGYFFEYASNNFSAVDGFKDRVVQAFATYEPNECIESFLDTYEIFPVDEVHISSDYGLEIVKIKTLDECRYKPVKLSFINKFGALQDLWFFRKSIKQLSVTKEEYKRGNPSYYGIYNPGEPQRAIFNKQGAEKITINTGYVDESYNEPMKELMLSEHVWMEQDTVLTPMVIETSSLTYKTSANDKLVDYTLDLAFAFNAIQNMR